MRNAEFEVRRLLDFTTCDLPLATHPSAWDIIRYGSGQCQCGVIVYHIFMSIGCFVLMQDTR